MGGNQVLLGHDILNLDIIVTLEPEVTVCYDATQFSVLLYYRYTTDMVLGHKGKGVPDSIGTENCNGVIYHSILSTLYDCNLTRLFSNRHILVNNAYTTLTGNGNSHT